MVSISHGLTRFSNVLCSESDRAAGGRDRTVMRCKCNRGHKPAQGCALIAFGSKGHMLSCPQAMGFAVHPKSMLCLRSA